MIGLPRDGYAAIDRIGRRPRPEQSTPGQVKLPLRELVREVLLDAVIVSDLEYVREVLE
jgi:hypothetical protein